MRFPASACCREREDPTLDQRPTLGPALPAWFQPATRDWFGAAFGAPTDAQAAGWAAIAKGRHTLISAPTGSGKTLAAFLSAIDALVAEAGALPARTAIVYVSPLKALSNDVARNLEAPLAGIDAAHGAPLGITTAVRTGDTPSAARARMVRRPPHILVTTPEGLYALVTSQGGRSMLSDVRTLIVDEIHALAPDRRGAHLALTMERLDALVGQPVQRIGLSATQNPIGLVANFLTGGQDCAVVEAPVRRTWDLRVEMPATPLAAVMPNEGMDEVYDRIAAMAADHRTTLVFVNARRQCERVAHHLAERLGTDNVAAHHGSLSPALRQHAEARLKAGDLQVLVATASLELGLDIGDVDLVVQVGSVKRIAMFLQRAGRSNHHAGGTPKARVIPLSRDELLECVALLRAVDAGDLDTLCVPDHPLDVLAQQIVAAGADASWTTDALFALVRRAWPYRALDRAMFDAVLDMLATGFPTERGRRGTLIAYDRVNQRISTRKGAKITALTSGGTIPDSGDYQVRLEPQGVIVGAIAEDFAIHQVPGHVIQLGSNTWRVLQVKGSEVRVEAAPGQAPYMPVWFGESPARSAALSREVSRLRAAVAADPEGMRASLATETWLDTDGAQQLVAYLGSVIEALQAMPTDHAVVAERFSDQAGDRQIVIHAPFGARINRAWGLALRHRLGAQHDVELQAAATDDQILISLPARVDLPLARIFAMVSAHEVEAVVTEAVLDVPMFMIRWRWAAARALAVPRQRGGRRVPPHIQRTDADELLLAAFPGQRGGTILRREGKEGGLARSDRRRPGPADVPDHPLIAQTLADCLHEAMDVTGLRTLLEGIEAGRIATHAVDRLTPSAAAFAVLTAKPPAFLDDGAMMDRRARNAGPEGPRHLSVEADMAVHPDALSRVRQELAPDLASAEDLATHLSLTGVLTAEEIGDPALIESLSAEGRATRIALPTGRPLWAATERLGEIAAALPAARPAVPDTDIAPADALASVLRGRLEVSGPVTPDEIAMMLGVDPALASTALERLGEEGAVLSGRFDPDRPGVETWCDRRVLARIERLTRNRLRAEVEPVTLQQFYRFLLRWHGLGPDPARRGRSGLADALAMLDGIDLPAGVWEAEVLPARVAGYDMDDLDELCLSGQVGWGRLSQPGAKRQSLSRATPIALFDMENLDTWRALKAADAEPPLSATAAKLLAEFQTRGASFIGQIERSLRLLRSQYETGLMELVAAGRLTADSFAGLRALMANPSRLRVSRLDLIGNSNSGRWSLLPQPEPLTDPIARNAAAERYARSLLRRYGVVVRSVVQREATALRWYEILRVLRRMEARGEVRGGYFVDGAGGEHYALPEALPILRTIRGEAPKGDLIALSAADPLNLTGTVTPGPRIPSRGTARLLLRDGHPIAWSDGAKSERLDGTADPLTAAERAALSPPKPPAGLAVYR